MSYSKKFTFCEIIGLAIVVVKIFKAQSPCLGSSYLGNLTPYDNKNTLRLNNFLPHSESNRNTSKIAEKWAYLLDQILRARKQHHKLKQVTVLNIEIRLNLNGEFYQLYREAGDTF